MIKTLSFILVLASMLTIPACGGVSESAQSLNAELSLLHTAALASGTTTFSDVRKGAWYEDAVLYCLENDILSGTSETAFSPSEPLTRAMLAAIVHHMAGRPDTNAAADFLDVADDSWYSDAVAWASEGDIISGYGNGIFGTNDAVTREQMVAILWRFAGSPLAGQETNFTDASTISEWAVSAVHWAKSKGIISGKEDNRFAPKNHITRAEAAAVLYRWHSGAQDNDESGGKMLVAYFSATGATRSLAE